MRHFAKKHTYIYILTLLLCLHSAAASDLAKEKRWADQIVDALLIGEVVWLDADKQKFLGLFTEHTSEKPVGGVILMHGIGVHPNWPDVVFPLRSQLPDYGWATLSIQMPILANDAAVEDYKAIWDEAPPRVDAAVKYLRKRGIDNIVIVAHSLGSAMASYYLTNKQANIRAFVGIGMTELGIDPRMNNVDSLRKLTLPVFDLYGANDLDNVLNSTKARQTAATKAGNKSYSQLAVPGADHFFTGMEDALVNRVKSWLANNATDN